MSKAGSTDSPQVLALSAVNSSQKISYRKPRRRSSRHLDRSKSSRKQLKLTTYEERLKTKKEIKAEKKQQRHEKEIEKIKRQLEKHGQQYLGPPEEDHYWNLLLCNRPYRRDVMTTMKNNDNYTNIHYQRFMIAREAVEEAKHQVQRLWLELFSDLIFVGAIVKFAEQIKTEFKDAVSDPSTQLIVVAQAFGIFVPFFVLWLELNVVLIRFADIEGGIWGIIDDFLLFVFMLSLIMQAVQIQTNEHIFSEARTYKLVLTMIVSLLSLFFLHLLYRIRIVSARKFSCVLF